MAGRSATTTVLFAEVEDAASSWQRPEAMRRALAVYDDVMRSAVAEHGGTVLASAGEHCSAAFERPDAAVAAAIAAQAALARAAWPDGVALKARMGADTGPGHRDDRDAWWYGPAARASRVADAANGAQILVTGATREAVTALAPSTTLVDLGVHQLRDVVEPVRLFRVEDRAFITDARPPRTGTSRTGNLPAPAGSLLGRSADVAAVVDALADARVVTLTGMGGIGKTRLALEAARQLASGRRDGAWFVALDTVDRRDAVLTLLLGTLAIELRSGGALDSLVAGLRFRDALLVLDNCEHVLDTAAEVVSTVVAACPHVQVLATSREPLDVPGERTRRVDPLDTDDGGPAVALFRLRAEEAGASLDPARDGPAVARICRGVGGIPLAIELAAARTRSLRPADIAERLDEMLGLLTTGRRTGPARHRTLRATLEWSYDLLDEREQSVLARLSVLAGSFPLAAAEAIAGFGPVRPHDVVDAVDGLVRRSLVVPVDDTETSRFRLLEPVRQFAAEQLQRRGEAADARERHARWYADLVRDLGERWRNGDDQAVWPVAARELPNLKTAFDHLVAVGRLDDAERFVVDAYGPVNLHFDNTPIYDWAPRLASIERPTPGEPTASVCAIAAWGAMTQGDLEGAATLLRRAEAAVERGSRDDGLVLAAAVHHVLLGGERAVTPTLVARSTDEALRSGDLHRQVWVLTYSGRAEEALDAARRLGNKTLLAMAHSILAQYADRVAPGLDDEALWEAREEFWEAARRCHSFLMLGNAAHQLGVGHILRGAALDGLLLLRAPARDWLLRGDTRVWAVLHSIATGLAAAGDVTTAARLAGAIGDRHVWAISATERDRLHASLAAGLDVAARRRCERAGADLDAGAAVAEALERIESLAAARVAADRTFDVDDAALTPRQREISALIAQGLSNKQIARRLGISRYTAETHVRNILERLGGASRAEIAAWAVKRSLSTPAGGSGSAART